MTVRELHDYLQTQWLKDETELNLSDETIYSFKGKYSLLQNLYNELIELNEELL